MKADFLYPLYKHSMDKQISLMAVCIMKVVFWATYKHRDEEAAHCRHNHYVIAAPATAQNRETIMLSTTTVINVRRVQREECLFQHTKS